MQALCMPSWTFQLAQRPRSCLPMKETQSLIPGSGRSLGRENGNPLQHSCLGNPTNRGAWQAIVHGVAKSQTWLSYWGYTYTLCHFTKGIWGFRYLWGFWRQSIPKDGLLPCSPTKLGMWKVAHKKREFSWLLLLLLLFFQKAHFQNWLRHLVYDFTYTLITPLFIISIMMLIRILS